MIRFIDIRDQGTGYRFSFWDTVRDEYIGTSNEYAWDTWEEFRELNLFDSQKYERCKRLCPEWVFHEAS